MLDRWTVRPHLGGRPGEFPQQALDRSALVTRMSRATNLARDDYVVADSRGWT
jgi:hypothetical protein